MYRSLETSSDPNGPRLFIRAFDEACKKYRDAAATCTPTILACGRLDVENGSQDKVNLNDVIFADDTATIIVTETGQAEEAAQLLIQDDQIFNATTLSGGWKQNSAKKDIVSWLRPNANRKLQQQLLQVFRTEVRQQEEDDHDSSRADDENEHIDEAAEVMNTPEMADPHPPRPESSEAQWPPPFTTIWGSCTICKHTIARCGCPEALHARENAQRGGPVEGTASACQAQEGEAHRAVHESHTDNEDEEYDPFAAFDIDNNPTTLHRETAPLRAELGLAAAAAAGAAEATGADVDLAAAGAAGEPEVIAQTRILKGLGRPCSVVGDVAGRVLWRQAVVGRGLPPSVVSPASTDLPACPPPGLGTLCF